MIVQDVDEDAEEYVCQSQLWGTHINTYRH